MNYFITFRCYGTWLHGDERGSVDQTHNQHGEPLLEVSSSLLKRRRRAMKSSMAILDEARQVCVEATIREVALHRGWNVLALKVLSSHVHVVVSAEENIKPEKIVIDFKAWSTRRLREKNLIPVEMLIWSEHASTRYLWDAQAVSAACSYIETQTEREA